jgi:hypothetical protein
MEKSGWQEAQEHQKSDHGFIHGEIIGLCLICTRVTRTSCYTDQRQRLKQW